MFQQVWCKFMQVLYTKRAALYSVHEMSIVQKLMQDTCQTRKFLVQVNLYKFFEYMSLSGY